MYENKQANNHKIAVRSSAHLKTPNTVMCLRCLNTNTKQTKTNNEKHTENGIHQEMGLHFQKTRNSIL